MADKGEKIRLKRYGQKCLITCCSTDIRKSPNSYRIVKYSDGQVEFHCEECGEHATLEDLVNVILNSDPA